MIWALVQNGRLLFQGSYKQALEAAERLGVLYHLISVEISGKPERIMVLGRGFTDDGTEIPARLERGYLIAPAQMLALGRRRAA